MRADAARRRRAHRPHAHLAARSALVLAEKLYGEFAAVKLLQPFETSLQEKQRLHGRR